MRMVDYQKQADKTANEIAKSYVKAANYINDEMAKIFRTFEVQGGLSEQEALRLLNNLPDKWVYDSLKETVKTVKDPAKRRALLSVINSPAYAYRIRRFEELQKDIDRQTKNIAAFEQTVTRAHYISLAGFAFEHAVFDIQKGIGFSFPFSRMSESRVTQILKRNWSGKLFSERIWDKEKNINATLKEELLTQFMTGRSYKKTAENIQNAMAVGAMEARRLVRTESTYIANCAEMESYTACGIKKFKFLATLDMRTSEICASMDGKTFDVDKAVPGTNVPPLHPWCRSTTVAVIDSAAASNLERRARDPKTGKTYLVPEDMSYADWKKSIDERYGKGTWETERKMLINRPSDMEQYRRYKSILGKENMPKTFDMFRDLKYNNIDEWENVKYYARNINGRPIEYVKIDRELEKLKIRKGTACIPDDEIKAYILPDTDSKREPYHIMYRMKERNITDDDLRSFKNNAIVAMSQWNGKRLEYYSSDGVCVISRTNAGWVYKTAWKKEDFDETAMKVLEVCRKYVK